MNISQNGIDLIKSFEGLKLVAYKPVPTEKEFTIGYGHYGSDVREHEVITAKVAEDLLKKDLQKFVTGVDKAVTVSVNQNQFDALVSFSYNLGVGALQKSTLLEKVNNKDFDGAAKEFGKWVKAGGNILDGLVKRRAKEAALFLKPVLENRPTVKLESKSKVVAHVDAAHKPVKTVKKAAPKKNYMSVVDFLADHNRPYDFVSRVKLAKKYGIHGYNGHPDQNTKLLKLLQEDE